jgi:hypothetical protein
LPCKQGSRVRLPTAPRSRRCWFNSSRAPRRSSSNGRTPASCPRSTKVVHAVGIGEARVQFSTGAPRERGRMARHTASTRDTSVRSRPLAQCRRSRLVRRHVANVVQAGSIPVSCSELVGLLERWPASSTRRAAPGAPRSAKPHRVGSSPTRVSDAPTDGTARRLLSACGQVRFLMGVRMSRSSSGPGISPLKGATRVRTPYATPWPRRWTVPSLRNSGSRFDPCRGCYCSCRWTDSRLRSAMIGFDPRRERRRDVATVSWSGS